jgi:hypothetical protein
MSSHGVGTLMALPAVIALKTSLLFLSIGNAPKLKGAVFCTTIRREGGEGDGTLALARKKTVSLILTMQVLEMVLLLVFGLGE